jgi:hypothetical protein
MARLRYLFRKTGITILGFALLVTGAVLLVLPGPGILVIILGLVVLSWEYEWAKHHLKRARLIHHKALEKARRRKNT